jgi:biopolymer transport protein ExbB
LRLVTTGNPMLWPLALCSVVALGFALERLIALRRDRVIPRDFVNRFLERLSSGKLDRERAVELCRANDSPVARVFAHAIRYWGQPAAAIRQALGHDAAGELADLKRNVRVLNGTATLSPLLGLLGTVIGMIESFDALGVGGPAGTGRGEQLAHGISLALMTTAAGLAIAVISVVAYYYLLHQIDALVRELDDQTMKVIDLVAGESSRATTDRWTTLVASDLGRHATSETRTLGRAEPVVRPDPV